MPQVTMYGPRGFLLCTIITLQTHTHNKYYLLLFHGKNGYANAPQCCVIVQYVACLLFRTLYCGCVTLFYNVWVCVCVGFVLC
jgi:hypothetical protein